MSSTDVLIGANDAVLLCLLACRLTFKMLRGRFQTLFFLVLLAVGPLMAASEKTSDEAPRECPPGSQAKTSTGRDDDGDDDDEDQFPCVAALSLEPTEDDEPPVPPTSDEDGEDAAPAESSTLIIHYDH